MSEKLTKVAQQQSATVMGVSPTGALNTAVDRMSFAHDIVMMTDSTIAVGIGCIETVVSKPIVWYVVSS